MTPGNSPPASVTHAIWVRIRPAKRLAGLLKEIPHMTVIASEAAGAEMPREYPRRAAVISWIFFDWAAQPYFTLITTFVFAPYFASFVAPDPAQGQALWGFATAAAGLMIALLSPVLGAIADASGRRKPWIAGFGALLVIGACADVVRKARRPQRHPAAAARLCDRERRRRIRHRLQQRDDADAGAAGQDRAVVRHRMGHRLYRRHPQPRSWCSAFSPPTPRPGARCSA